VAETIILLIIVCGIVASFATLLRRTRLIDAKLTLLLKGAGVRAGIPEQLRTRVKDYLSQGKENAAVGALVSELSVDRETALALIEMIKVEMDLA